LPLFPSSPPAFSFHLTMDIEEDNPPEVPSPCATQLLLRISVWQRISRRWYLPLSLFVNSRVPPLAGAPGKRGDSRREDRWSIVTILSPGLHSDREARRALYNPPSCLGLGVLYGLTPFPDQYRGDGVFGVPSIFLDVVVGPFFLPGIQR